MRTSQAIIRVDIKFEQDVVQARQRAKQIAELLGFDHPEQIRIATAISEIARNALQYAGKGWVEFALVTAPVPRYRITVHDSGKGIADLQTIMNGQYVSKTGMGLGIVGSQRLMDGFHVESSPSSGTTVVLEKNLPVGRPVDNTSISHIARTLTQAQPRNAYEEMQRQNRDLIRALDDLHAKQQEVVALNERFEEANQQLLQTNHELEETNRGVLALYKELDEKALELRKANELKGQFLSNMSHEFRTPLNAVLGLSRLLLDRADGELTPEQEKQIDFIYKAADELSAMVNDLLDLAKVESGKTTVYRSKFDISDLFGTLKGMFRPIMGESRVQLVFEERGPLPTLDTDEGKISQILRNFISNAIKFTEAGEIRVSALMEDPQTLAISVSDSGIGIAPDDLARIFDEFTQVAHKRQNHLKGTGLGLPLSRRFAKLLGGDVHVMSEPGTGSTFTARIPIAYRGESATALGPISTAIDQTRTPVIFFEDNRQTLDTYEKFLAGTGFQLIPAETIDELHGLAATMRPAAFVIDILLRGGQKAWHLVTELKNNPRYLGIPVFVATVVSDEAAAFAAGADAYALKPIERSWLVRNLAAHAHAGRSENVLIIDDDPKARYLLANFLQDTKYRTTEAATGEEGVRLARESRPDVIILDYMLPGMTGYDVLLELRSHEETAAIPVVINTSKPLDESELDALRPLTKDILSKTAAAKKGGMNRLREALIKARSGTETGMEAAHDR